MSNEITLSEAKVTEQELIMHLDNLGITKDLTSGEKNTFIQIAKAYNLNPFKREIHVSKYAGQFSIVVGYETYIKRAERSGLLDGWDVVTTGDVKDNSLKAVITIYRKDRSKPFVWEVKYSEYVGKTKEGYVTKFWQKAETMTKKVAMSQGFRLCFNDELGGMPYTKEEMPDITEDVTHEEVKQPEVKKQKLNTKALNDAIDRIIKGEGDLADKVKETFDLTDDQLKKLDAAVQVGLTPTSVEPTT